MQLADGTWAVFDDDKVSRVSSGDSISCPYAYLLFYRRVEGDVKDQEVNTTREDGDVVADLHNGEENGEPSHIASMIAYSLAPKQVLNYKMNDPFQRCRGLFSNNLNSLDGSLRFCLVGLWFTFSGL